MAIPLPCATFKKTNYLRFRMLKQTLRALCNINPIDLFMWKFFHWRLGNICSRPYIWHYLQYYAEFDYIWHVLFKGLGCRIIDCAQIIPQIWYVFLLDSHNQPSVITVSITIPCTHY